jgi:ABC-type transport system substrate-binding protein
LWDCETGVFVYLGINSESSVFQSQKVRQAISKGVDRDALVDRYYRGFATAAELPASPNSAFYTAPLAKQYAYDPVAYQEMMVGMKDRTVKLLVNSSDSLRVRVAQEIGRMLNASGLLVEVVAKASYAYEAALIEGDYDLYLGQTKLSPNMDLTPFFSENGALNYGDIDDIGVYTLCLQALENQGNYYTMHQRVMEDAYLCPLLFRSYAVYASRGLLTDLQPARDNVFCYSIGKTQTDAYVVGGT